MTRHDNVMAFSCCCKSSSDSPDPVSIRHHKHCYRPPFPEARGGDTRTATPPSYRRRPFALTTRSRRQPAKSSQFKPKQAAGRQSAERCAVGACDKRWLDHRSRCSIPALSFSPQAPRRSRHLYRLSDEQWQTNAGGIGDTHTGACRAAIARDPLVTTPCRLTSVSGNRRATCVLSLGQ